MDFGTGELVLVGECPLNGGDGVLAFGQELFVDFDRSTQVFEHGYIPF